MKTQKVFNHSRVNYVNLLQDNSKAEQMIVDDGSREITNDDVSLLF